MIRVYDSFIVHSERPVTLNVALKMFIYFFNKKINKKPGFLNIVQSVIAAMFGVQSDSNREQDFTHGKASDYIIAGIIGVILFVLTILWLVNTIINNYQG